MLAALVRAPLRSVGVGSGKHNCSLLVLGFSSRRGTERRLLDVAPRRASTSARCRPRRRPWSYCLPAKFARCQLQHSCGVKSKPTCHCSCALAAGRQILCRPGPYQDEPFPGPVFRTVSMRHWRTPSIIISGWDRRRSSFFGSLSAAI